MKDCIIVNETLYRCVVKSTGDKISLEFENGDTKVLKKAFQDLTELTMANSDGKVYAVYTNLTYLSITETSSSVTILFSTADTGSTDVELESRVAALESAIEDLAAICSELSEKVN